MEALGTAANSASGRAGWMDGGKMSTPSPMTSMRIGVGAFIGSDGQMLLGTARSRPRLLSGHVGRLRRACGSRRIERGSLETRTTTTLELDSHVLPGMQEEATPRLEASIFGRHERAGSESRRNTRTNRGSHTSRTPNTVTPTAESAKWLDSLAPHSNAMKRLEQPEPKYPKVCSDAVEQKNPELVPEVVDLASDPFETVAAMARKLEMPESTCPAPMPAAAWRP